MSKLPPPRKKQPETKAGLAAILEIKSHVITWHRRHSPDCPPDFNVDRWRIFLAARGRSETSPEATQIALANAKLKREEAKAEQEVIKLKKEQCELIERIHVAAFLRELVGIDIFGTFDRMAFEMPPNLVGLNAAQMFIEFKKEKERMKEEVLGKISNWEVTHGVLS